MSSVSTRRTPRPWRDLVTIIDHPKVKKFFEDRVRERVNDEYTSEKEWRILFYPDRRSNKTLLKFPKFRDNMKEDVIFQKLMNWVKRVIRTPDNGESLLRWFYVVTKGDSDPDGDPDSMIAGMQLFCESLNSLVDENFTYEECFEILENELLKEFDRKTWRRQHTKSNVRTTSKVAAPKGVQVISLPEGPR